MQEMIRKLQEESSRFGLHINFGKTKIMPIGPHAKDHPEQPIRVHNQKIKVVDHFEYLGRVLSSVVDDSIEVKQRICKGWQAFQKHKSILMHSHISMTRKKKTYETYIQPSVLYATETVTWNSTLLNKMSVFENHIMRWMCGIKLSERVPISTLRTKTNIQKDITKIIKLRKLQWYGHLKRSNLPVRVITEGITSGRRKRGRPARRWLQDITDWTGDNLYNINNILQDRNSWRNLCHRIV